MSLKVNCIMLIDDNKDDNFFHERVIKKNNAANVVIAKESGEEALNYLKSKDHNESAHPDLIFLDINMPGMNGWEFLEHYKKLDIALQSKMIVVMLTTSDNPEDKKYAQNTDVLAAYKTKPLTKEMLDGVLRSYYSK